MAASIQGYSMGISGTALPRFKSAEIRAVKILADGTRVDLGVVSVWHRNPIIRWALNLRLRAKQKLAGLARRQEAA